MLHIFNQRFWKKAGRKNNHGGCSSIFSKKRKQSEKPSKVFISSGSSPNFLNFAFE
jgi:hypothetical protein